MPEKADIASTPGWRTGLLFLLFAIISVLLEHGTEWLEHRFSRRRGHARSNGFLTMLTFIKQELFLLGLISMLLTAVQEPMLRICIPNNVARYGLHWTPEEQLTIAGNYAEKGDGYKGRHLLGGPPKGDTNFCGKDGQPLFSAYMIYQVHLLIFLLAVIHVIYVAGTLMVCLFQVNEWHNWEEEAPSSDAFLRLSGAPTTPRVPTTPRRMPKNWAHPRKRLIAAREGAKALWRRVGTNRFTHGLRVAFAVVTTDLLFSPVTRAGYYSLRLMFIDRLGLDHTFDFASFVERSIEEHVPYLMKLNAAMMCLAAGLLSFPFPAYLPYWLFGLSVLVELVLAGKLASVCSLMAGQALMEYGNRADFGDLTESEMGDSNGLEAIMVDDGLEPPLLESPKAAAKQAARRGGGGRRADGESCSPFAGMSAVPFPDARRDAAAPLQPALRPVRTTRAADYYETDPMPLDARAITRRIERCATLQELEDFVAAHGGTFNQIHVSLALLQLHRIAERQRLAQQSGDAQPPAAPTARNEVAPWGQKQQQPLQGALKRSSDPCATDDIEWRKPDQPGATSIQVDVRAKTAAIDGACRASAMDSALIARRAASADGSVPPPSPSITSARGRARHQRVMERVAALPRNPSKLFWFGRPGLLLFLFQFVFYSNAFLLTLASFAFWQKHTGDWMYEGVGITTTILLMVGSVLLAIHSALRVLPLFALVEPVGRHQPENVLRRALKEGGLRPDEASALAAQLGVDLPAEKETKKRRMSWLGDGRAASEGGGPEGKARSLMQKLLAIKPKPARKSEAAAAAVAAADDDDEARDYDPTQPASGRVGSRRSLEGLKTASMAQLLQLLAATEGLEAGAMGGSANPMQRESLAATTPKSLGGFLDGDGHSEYGGEGGGGGGGGGLHRSRSAASLGGHGGGGHGGGHGDGGASSNVELAAEMIRGLLLKQARANQPVTPRSGPASNAGDHAGASHL